MPTRIGPRNPVHVYLAEWRGHFGLTQQQVADRIAGGINKNNISRWETADRMPSVDVLAAYAEALGIPVSRLYRPPSDRPSLDEMIANASNELKDKAAEVVRIIIKTGT